VRIARAWQDDRKVGRAAAIGLERVMTRRHLSECSPAIDPKTASIDTGFGLDRFLALLYEHP
jgi:hypothetical protein